VDEYIRRCFIGHYAIKVTSVLRAVYAQSIFVRLRGTAGPSLNPNQAEAGLLVVAGSEVLLFDCGHGVPDRLAQVGRTGVSKVFLTHVHSDHTEGLPELLDE
jgi:ribonuclease BN (tRNA processing enzyme)